MYIVSQGQTPFRWWRIAEVATEKQLWNAYGTIPPPAWPDWVRYSNDIERGKRTTRDLRDFPSLFELAYNLSTSEDIRELERLTGIADLRADPDKHGAGLHLTEPGGWLQVHGDYEVHPRLDGWERRLNLILWLNPEWRDEWGGALRLCDGTGQAILDFYPAFGEAVLFEAGPVAFHGAMQTALEAPPRATMTAYYLAPMRMSATRKRALFMSNRDAPKCPREVAIPFPVG